LQVGYQRPLEINDIPPVSPNRTTPIIAARLQEAFNKRVECGSNRPLALAIFDTFRTDIYIGGAGSLTATLIQTLLPFVLKYLITFVTEAYFADKTGGNGPAIGIGIGWALGISGVQILGSIGNNHFVYRGMLVGGQVRSALISLIFNKAMTISGRAKAGWKPPQEPPAHIKRDSDEEKNWYADQMEAQSKTHGWSNGRIVTLMSTDTNRIDKASGWFHMVWTSPVAMLVTIALLLINLTYSALPGIGMFLLSVPIMELAFRAMFSNGTKINTLTDKSLTLTQEVLHAIRFVKYYASPLSLVEYSLSGLDFLMFV
jgi:ATP-binding cassette subfamily C (CFTR/MRP) protein 1